MTYLTAATVDQTNSIHSLAASIVKRASFEHVTQQGREDALLNIIVEALTPAPEVAPEATSDAAEETAPPAPEEGTVPATEQPAADATNATPVAEVTDAAPADVVAAESEAS